MRLLESQVTWSRRAESLKARKAKGAKVSSAQETVTMMSHYLVDGWGTQDFSKAAMNTVTSPSGCVMSHDTGLMRNAGG